jgi:hypothetical protein
MMLGARGTFLEKKFPSRSPQKTFDHLFAEFVTVRFCSSGWRTYVELHAAIQQLPQIQGIAAKQLY